MRGRIKAAFSLGRIPSNSGLGFPEIKRDLEECPYLGFRVEGLGFRV